MKYLLLLIFLLFSTILFAQNLWGTETYRIKSDSDVTRLLTISSNSSTVEINRIEIFDNIARYYSEKGVLDKAITYASKIIDVYPQDRKMEEYAIYWKSSHECLGDVYFKLKVFPIALSYYDVSDPKYHGDPALYNSVDKQNHARRLCKKALTYDSLNNYQRAVEMLTPFMFDATMDNYFDSNDVNMYVSSLYHLYPHDKIESSLPDSVNKMTVHYYYTQAPIKPGQDSLFNTYYTFAIGDITAELQYNDYTGNGTKRISEKYIRQPMLKRITTSVAYKKIME
jgi:tetratricopeptide (TPR) repeat protein